MTAQTIDDLIKTKGIQGYASINRWRALRYCCHQLFHIALGGSAQIHIVTQPKESPYLHIVVYEAVPAGRLLLIRHRQPSRQPHVP
jgi:hypothetical protein